MKFSFIVMSVLLVAALIVVVVRAPVAADFGQLGNRARDFVKGPYSSIVFEIDYFTTRPEIAPNQNEVARFLTFVEQYTGKKTSVVYQTISSSLATTGHWDDNELRALDEQTRSAYSSFLFGNVLAVHIIYANGLYEPPDNDVTGLALRATTIVIFKGLFETIAPDAEDAILAHEFGHLLGLCGQFGDPSSICDGAGHAKDAASLMAVKIDMRVPAVQELRFSEMEVAMLNAL